MPCGPAPAADGGLKAAGGIGCCMNGCTVPGMPANSITRDTKAVVLLQ
jgi:hypothetical protein